MKNSNYFKALLLVNLGTPQSPQKKDVRRFLREFLMDRYVVDLPYVVRWILVHLVILPFRPQKTARLYERIWTQEGSPLLVGMKKLALELGKRLGSLHQVEIGMRYGMPNLRSALEQLKKQACEKIYVLPLFPQYARATNETAIKKIIQEARRQKINNVEIFTQSFHDHPAFIEAYYEIIKTHMGSSSDYLLFSYHGLPQRQDKNNYYERQCRETTQLIAQKLNLPENNYGVAFQSRLGKIPWIMPYTDEVLSQLAKQGIKNISIVCPSFVTDCLETLEEIGIRAREQWKELGGESFTLIPSLNAHPKWIEGLTKILQINI